MLRDEISAYRDADGLVSPTKTTKGQRNASGNGVLYTSLYFITAMRIGELKLGDLEDFKKTMNACFEQPGLLRRGPVQPDQEGPDDYIGLCAASSLCGIDFAQKVYEYGRTHWMPAAGFFPVRFFYNNVLPGSAYGKDGKTNWSAWLGRQPQVVAHIEICAGVVPPLWRRMAWAAAVVASAHAKPTDQDAWMLSWLLVFAAANVPYLPMRLASAYWRKRFQAAYGDETQKVCARCLADLEHPLGRAFRA